MERRGVKEAGRVLRGSKLCHSVCVCVHITNANEFFGSLFVVLLMLLFIIINKYIILFFLRGAYYFIELTTRYHTSYVSHKS